MTVWLVYGRVRWQDFNEGRLGAIDDDNMESSDGFFFLKDNGRKAEVRKFILDKLDELKRDLKDKSKSLSLLVELIRIILNVNPQTRITAENLVPELDKVLELAKQGVDILPEIKEPMTPAEGQQSLEAQSSITERLAPVTEASGITFRLHPAEENDSGALGTFSSNADSTRTRLDG